MESVATHAIGVSPTNNVGAYTDLLWQFRDLPKLRYQRTFMEIAGYNENVCSNILKFFLNPENEHGLDDLLLNAFLTCLKKEELSISSVNVDREFSIDRKRLDILITSDAFVLGIENKLGAPVTNPLPTYGKGIEARKSEGPGLKIVLSLRTLTPDELKKVEDNKFTPVTYKQLFDKLKPLIGNYGTKADVRYLTYLNDFIKTIESRMDTNTDNQETMTFFQKHGSDIEALGKQYQKYRDYQFQELERYLSQVESSQFASTTIAVEPSSNKSRVFFFKVSKPNVTILMQTEWDGGDKQKWRTRFSDRTRTGESVACLRSIIEQLNRDPATKLEGREDPNAASYYSPENASVERVAKDVKEILRIIVGCVSVAAG